ncbi:MAG: aminotransferase class V-fold PLP-dependent enzyme [Acidobacteria bacterium]|nr:aminotransferase class V-fold PLP-dependent enzyme [Acidobacteriota bacterium]
MLTRWRAETPGTAHRIHLNNAGASLMPAPVHTAIVDHLRLESEIGGYEAAEVCAEAIATGYEDLAALLGTRPRNIAVVANATAGFVQALSSFDFAPGDVIVTSRCDYTSNQIQYLALRDRLGIEIVHAPDLPEGGIDPDGLRAAIVAAQGRARCRLVALSWIPTNSGLVQDVEAAGAVCESLGIPFLVDACQAVGQVPISVSRVRCDFLSTTARKFLRGPRGIGFMYVSDRALARGDYPLFVDMRGARWIAESTFELTETASRYEDWEFPYALVMGQAAAARYALEVGVETAQARSWALAARLRHGLETIPGVRVLDRGAVRCAIVTMAVEGGRTRGLVPFLTARQINTSLSVSDYGRYDFGDKAVDEAVRLSPHYYNTEAEVDAAIATVAEFAGQ